tara:strand:- start:225 stop:1046 length:822 start_codon:yes stop_codon:yes gene_type:complete
MFRIGGSAGTGITSGLDRPGYRRGVGPNMLDVAGPLVSRPTLNTSTVINRPVPEVGFLSKQKGVGLGPGTLPGFLTQFGLNLASATPRGNIFATAASAAQEPFQTFQQAKFAEAQSEREFEREKELVDLERANKLENIEKKARVMADTPGNPFFGDLEGAINELSRKELYGVQDMPGEKRQQKIDETVDAFLSQPGADPSERSLYERQAVVINDRELIEKDNENIKLGINPIIAEGRKDYVDGETYYSGETDEFFIFDSSNPENPFTKVDVKR